MGTAADAYRPCTRLFLNRLICFMFRPNPSEARLQDTIDKSKPTDKRFGRNMRPRMGHRSHRRGGSFVPEIPTVRTLPSLPTIKIDVPADKSSMQELFNKEQKYFAVPKSGDVISATVVDRSNNEVRLSLDGYGTGVVRGRELFDELDEYSKLQPGDKVEASIVELENENGEMELSFRQAGHERVWKNILDKLASNEIIKVKILDANKGGLIVVYKGMQGFIPVSQLTTEHYPRVEDGDKQRILERLQSYIGNIFELKILDADPAEEKLIFSEKAAQLEQKKDVFDKLHVGDVVEGKVTGIVDFGAFVQFDDMEGLVHISEMAWQRIDDPRDILKVGQDVKAQIIGLDGSRISLSMKKLIRDPWLDAVKKYSVGQMVSGKITKVTPFGAFVQLDDDIHGLVHISELSLKQIKDPAEVVAAGDKKDFKILSIEPGEHRLGLSLKAVEADKAGIKLESDTGKISLAEMEKMAAKKEEKISKKSQTKKDIELPEIMGEKSEKALLDEKKHSKKKATIKKVVKKRAAKKK